MGNDEIAAQIVQSLFQARAAVIAAASSREGLLDRYLGDEAAASAYKAVLKAIDDPYDQRAE